MAKIAVMPNAAIIDGFAGHLDFYTWCNLTIVRSWPRRPTGPRSLACALAGQQFAYINKQVATLDPTIYAQYQALSQGNALTAKDWLNRLYINAEKYLIEEPP